MTVADEVDVDLTNFTTEDLHNYEKSSVVIMTKKILL